MNRPGGSRVALGRAVPAALLFLFFCCLSDPVLGQGREAPGPDLFDVANSNLQRTHGLSLFEACPIAENLAAETVFREYGAVFAAGVGVTIPTKCVFENEQQVISFQNGIDKTTRVVAGSRITLQTEAMNAFLAARAEGRKAGVLITPRGTARAAGRSFAETLKLWNSRFLPALAYWRRRGKITGEEAAKVKKAPIPEQVAQVLKWEQDGLFFARGYSKSILFSVAAPGASQHISLLALDVKQYSSKKVRMILADHGWFQTVRSDYPHFTYLGVPESRLRDLGLESVEMGGYLFWVPRTRKHEPKKTDGT